MSASSSSSLFSPAVPVVTASQNGYRLDDNNIEEDDAVMINTPTAGLSTSKMMTATAPCIAAVIEGRGSASEIGIATYNMETCHCSVAQIADTAGYGRVLTLLNVHQPNQVLCCNSGEGVQSVSKLQVVLADYYALEQLVPWPRKHYNDTQGMYILQSLCLAELLPSASITLAHKYFAHDFLISTIDFRI